MNCKWELVLLEWVNCLKMSPPIEKLESLQNGQFLSNFMNALVKTQLGLPNIIPHIKSFINAEYPSFNFNLSLSSDNISELPPHELMPLLSILMHHSCIVNQRDVFTSPMCYHISKESQIYIKRFLEEMNCSIGDINLSEVINKCISIEEGSSINQWISSAGDSPLNSRTPLKDYLRTPFKTRFLTKKEHEIRKLRTCLELESFEKSDLNEELKEHKDKIEQLKLQLNLKSQEVSKLKNELFETERKHSPRSTKKKYDLNIQLRAEISDLEKYTSQLQSEQEELQLEKDSSNRKLNKAEMQLKSANEKIYSLEAVCDQLTDKHRDEQQELDTLRCNCSELNQLLSELRGSQLNNSSFLDSSQDNVTSSICKRRSRNLNDTASCEDLACSVIEVQLRDAQEENASLEQELNKTVEMNHSISIDMEKLKLKYEEVRKNLDVSEEAKINLNVKLEELKASFKDLQINRQELFANFNCVMLEKAQVSDEVHCLTKLNTDISVNLQLSICEVVALKDELIEAKSSEIAFKQLNDAHVKQIDDLNDKAVHLRKVLDEKVTDLGEAYSKTNILEEKFISLDSKFDSNLKKLQYMLRGNNAYAYIDKNEVFESLLIDFEVKERKDFEDKDTLRLKLRNFELDVDVLTKQIDNLKVKEWADFEFSLNMQESLKQAELKHEMLAKSIAQKDEVIGNFKEALKEMEATVDALNILKTKFMGESSLLNFVRDLQNVNKILESKTLMPVREISEHSNDSGDNEDLIRIKEIWTENEKVFLKEAAKVNDNIAAILTELQKNTVELTVCTEDLKSKGLELKEVQQEFEDTKNEFELSKLDSDARIQLLEDAKIKLEQEMSTQNQINYLRVQEIEQLSEKFKNLAEEKEIYVTKSEALKDEIKILAENVIISEKLCEDKDDVLAKTSLELLSWKLELESKKQDVTEMKDEMCKVYSELGVVKSEMLQLKTANECQEVKIDVLKQEVQFIDSLKQDLTKKNQDLEANNLHVIQQLTVKNRECNEFIEDLKKCKQKKELEILSLKQSLEKSNSEIMGLNKKFANASAKKDEEILRLSIEKVQLDEQISNLEAMEKDYIDEIKQIKSSLANLIQICFNFAKKNEISDDHLTSLKNKHDNYTTDDLEEVIQKIHSVLNYLQTRKVDVETDIGKQLLELKEFEEKEGLYKENIDILTSSANVLRENLESKENTLTKVLEKMADLETEFAAKEKVNEIYLASKVFGISNLRIEIEELKQTSSKDGEENKALLDAKENEVSKLQGDLENLEKVFSNYKKDVEEIRNYNKDLEMILSDVDEQNEAKDQLYAEQIQCLNDKYDELNLTCLNLEEIKAYKVKLQEILIGKEVIIEDVTSKLSLTQNNFEFVSNQLKDLEKELSEKVADLSKMSIEKSSLSIRLAELENALEKLKHDRDVILESHRVVLEESEVKIKNAHASAVQLKKDLEERLVEAQTDVTDSKRIQKEVEEALIREKTMKEALELIILNLQGENVQLEQVKFKYQCLIINLDAALPGKVKLTEEYVNNSVDLQEISNHIEKKIVDIISSKNDLADTIKVSKREQEFMQKGLFAMEEVQSELLKEKAELLQKFEQIQMEKSIQNQKNYEALSTDYDLLKAKYEQYKHYSQNNEKKHSDIEDKLQQLVGVNKSISENYGVFRQKYLVYKEQVEVLIKDRNLAEVTLSNLNEKWLSLQSKSSFIDEASYKSHFEKKAALEIIINDLQKQFSRCSKMTYNISFNLGKVFDVATQKIIAFEGFDHNFDQETLNETKQKLDELTELAEDAMKRIGNFDVPSEKNSSANILKESNINIQNAPSKDLEELRKKFNAIKQKLILVENAKHNYERKILLLRAENNKLSQNQRPLENMDSEAHYKTLLHQHLETKEEHETLITECEVKYKELLKEYDNYKKKHPRSPDSSSNNQIINKSLQDRSVKLEREVHKLRDAYGNLMSDKSKLDLENVTIKKVLDDRNGQIADLSLVKEAYEKLLEDNNKLQTDINTLRYKKTRDREEFARILKNEKDQVEDRERKRIQDIRNEYELKLEKMKDKMVRLYKEEVDKEMQKLFCEKSNNTTLMETIDHLRDELSSTQLKLHLIETERMSVVNQLQRHNPQQSTTTTTITHHHHQPPPQQLQLSTYQHHMTGDNLLLGHFLNKDSGMLRSDSRFNSRVGEASDVVAAAMVQDDRRSATLPRNDGRLDVLEEIRIRKRMSISAGNNVGLVTAAKSGTQLEMEDEDDMFNNKYLADLKEGRCQTISTLSTNPDFRMSELVYRNSQCLPHLKSSYPCETQFTNPSMYKEDDIKLGSNTAAPITSINTRHSHLPPPHPHHQRVRKDAGTTSYKRPGPPTPSKNGGRASLTSVDRVQGTVLPLREVNDGRASIATSVVQQARNRLTPTRLKALFTSKGRGNATAVGGTNASTAEQHQQASHIICQCACHTTVTVTSAYAKSNEPVVISPKSKQSNDSSSLWMRQSAIIIRLIRRLLQQRQRTTSRTVNIARKDNRTQRDYIRSATWWRIAQHMLFLTCVLCASASAVRYFHGAEVAIS